METFKSYLLGFILSILLTIAAFAVVGNHVLEGNVLIFAILVLAIIQLWVQLIFFLRLNHEKGPKWNLAVFLSTTSIILILVGGSLWIMHNLNYNHTSPSDTDTYILRNEGIYK